MHAEAAPSGCPLRGHCRSPRSKTIASRDDGAPVAGAQRLEIQEERRAMELVENRVHRGDDELAQLLFRWQRRIADPARGSPAACRASTDGRRRESLPCYGSSSRGFPSSSAARRQSLRPLRRGTRSRRKADAALFRISIRVSSPPPITSTLVCPAIRARTGPIRTVPPEWQIVRPLLTAAGRANRSVIAEPPPWQGPW